MPKKQFQLKLYFLIDLSLTIPHYFYMNIYLILGKEDAWVLKTFN